MSNNDFALATVSHVEQLADQLSDCADELHVRIVREIKAYGNTPMSDAEQAAARAVVSTLGASQTHLIALTEAAAAQIRNITLLGDATGLVAGLLMLAGAAAAGQPAPILKALEKITHQVQDLRTNLKKT